MSVHIDKNVTLRNWLWAALALKPYGNQLLSPSGDLWIGFVRLIVGALALVEGVSWAYVGSLAGGSSGWLSWLFALGLGCIIFVFVWGVDVSLMSLDLDSARTSQRERNPNEQTELNEIDTNFPNSDNSISAWQQFKDYWNWPLLPVGVRTALVVASLIVTAPFISMYVFRSEISHELENRFQANLDRVKEEKLREQRAQALQQQTEINVAQARVEATNQRYQQALQDYRKEVAGQSGTGRYGDGPAARANLLVAERIKLEMDALLAELERLTKNPSVLPATEQLKELEEAALRKDFAVLRVRFGVEDVPDSFVARSKVVTEKFMGTEEFKRVERSVQALLSFLAGALFLLKYFQPASVRIYFSETRQGQWHEYALGTYDHLLRTEDRAARLTSKPMAPLYFVRLWDDSIAPAIGDKGLAEAKARVLNIEAKHQIDLDKSDEIKLKIKEGSDECAKNSQKINKLEEDKNRLININNSLELVIEQTTELAGQPGKQNMADRLPELNKQKSDNQVKINNAVEEIVNLNNCLKNSEIDLAAANINLNELTTSLASVFELREALDKKYQELAHKSIKQVRG